MKNFLKFMTLAFLGAVLIVSCAKEDLKEMESVDTDQAEERIAPQPDLVITFFRSSLPNVPTPCSATQRMPFVGCSGGTTPPQFTFKARVDNIGNAGVPANSGLDIRWNLFGSGGTNTNIPQAIPAGGFVWVGAGPFTLPCPTMSPTQFITQTFYAVVDASDAINESNENNNYSVRLKMCDDL